MKIRKFKIDIKKTHPKRTVEQSRCINQSTGPRINPCSEAGCRIGECVVVKGDWRAIDAASGLGVGRVAARLHDRCGRDSKRAGESEDR